MSACCHSESTEKHPGKLNCPGSGGTCAAVGIQTVINHLKLPWRPKLKEQTYCFCSDPKCDVIYFGEDGCLFTQNEIQTPVGQKRLDDERTLCYCFHIKASDYRNNVELKTYVLEQTKAGLCSCDIQNPSGKCCFKDFS